MKCLVLLIGMIICVGSVVVPAHAALSRGPFVGHVEEHQANIWARFSQAGEYTLSVHRADTDPAKEITATASAVAASENDFCVTWDVSGLEPSTSYRYRIEHDGMLVAASERYTFETAPNRDTPTEVTMAFGSCARFDLGTARLWWRLGVLAPDVMILLGDTPYIDTTDLAQQRAHYRQFASFTAMQRLLQNTSWYGTWDDHDFGANDTDGNLPGKENSRQAFIEYHANPGYGVGDAGVFTSFRRGPVEVFLLDTRWFAATEPSPVDPGQLTLLGAAQWKWLRDALRQSDAPFKLIACGMIWNEAVRPGKLDHWGTYWYERDALFEFIGDNDIEGVVLVGGDIHRSRVIEHDSRDAAGYVLTELITSPMHWSIIEEANQPHPGLVIDMGEPHSVLLVRADTTVTPAALTVTYVNSFNVVLYETVITSDQLRREITP